MLFLDLLGFTTFLRDSFQEGSSDYFEKPPSSFLSSIPGYKTGLLAPYGVWVCFAAVLNDEIWRLNR